MPSRPQIPALVFVAALALLPTHAIAIEGGFVASTCAWPETVRVFSGWGAVPLDDANDKVTCTGVYIGGRTVLTASACVQQFPDAREIQFGDVFGSDPRSTVGIHVAVPVDGCLAHPNLPIAACRLSETPIMQAIPVMHACEAPTFLAQGNQAWVIGANATKQWATAQLPVDLPIEQTAFELPQDFVWTTSQGVDSTVLEDEDLGAPLFVRGPDASLRLAAVAIDVEPARWVGTWLLTDWLADIDEQDAIFPCHTVDGSWDPSPACALLLEDRSEAAGSWARGLRVCESQTQVVPVATCG